MKEKMVIGQDNYDMDLDWADDNWTKNNKHEPTQEEIFEKLDEFNIEDIETYLRIKKINRIKANNKK